MCGVRGSRLPTRGDGLPRDGSTRLFQWNSHQEDIICIIIRLFKCRSYTLISSALIVMLLHALHIHVHARVLQLPPTDQLRSFESRSPLIHARQDAPAPTFPSDPPSCPKCAASYENIDSCAKAAPVLANVSMIIFNPGAFIDVIKCACVDTFQAAYPQCVDCFIRTNQTEFLSASSDELPDIISGIRSICAIESTLLGNVSVVNGEVPTSSPAALPTDTTGLSSSAEHLKAVGMFGVEDGLSEVFASLVLGFLVCFV